MVTSDDEVTMLISRMMAKLDAPNRVLVANTVRDARLGDDGRD
ncbi:hypothetical protein GCM10027294_07270 [Marinactinospora endophytica]